jgi:hypothetical protein
VKLARVLHCEAERLSYLGRHQRASEVIAGIPGARISEITSELAQRQEYVTMGRFVGHLSEEALDAALRALDDEALVRTVFVTEDRLPFDELAGRARTGSGAPASTSWSSSASSTGLGIA